MFKKLLLSIILLLIFPVLSYSGKIPIYTSTGIRWVDDANSTGTISAEDVRAVVGQMITDSIQSNVVFTWDATTQRIHFGTSPTSENITGNAGTASKWLTSINIGGVAVDGSSDVHLPGVDITGSQDTSGTSANATLFAGHGVSFFQTALTNPLVQTDVEDTPVSGHTTKPVSSNHLYVHEHATNPHNITTITGNAGTASKWLAPINIGGVAVDGSASVNLPGVNVSGTQNTSGTASHADALTNTPSKCSAGYHPLGILANGNATDCTADGSGGGTDTGISGKPTAANQSPHSSGVDTASWVNDTVVQANVATFLGAADYAAMRTQLSLVPGTNVVAWNGAGGTPTSITLTNGTGLPTAGLVASTTQAVGFGTVELGHASDTTLSRSASGVLAVEGKVVPTVKNSGTSAMGTSAIASGACATVVSTTAANVATTSVIVVNPNTRISQVTGYGYATTGALRIDVYPTAGYVNFEVCNMTAASITPGALTLNWVAF